MYNEVAMQEEPHLWKVVPDRVKQMLVNRAKNESQIVARRIVDDLKTNIEEYFDLCDLVENAFAEEPALLNHMFISCGKSELTFIRDCGAYMGGLFGCVQVALWVWYSAGWMLPTFGFVVGLISNWIALKMIFNPVEPHDVCGLRIHGLFLQRQQEVSEVYAQIVSENILYARNIIRAILKGKLADEFHQLLEKHISQGTDEYFYGSLKFFRDEEKIKHMKKSVADNVLKSMDGTARHAELYMQDALGLEDLLCEKLQGLSS